MTLVGLVVEAVAAVVFPAAGSTSLEVKTLRDTAIHASAVHLLGCC